MSTLLLSTHFWRNSISSNCSNKKLVSIVCTYTLIFHNLQSVLITASQTKYRFLVTHILVRLCLQQRLQNEWYNQVGIHEKIAPIEDSYCTYWTAAFEKLLFPSIFNNYSELSSNSCKSSYLFWTLVTSLNCDKWIFISGMFKNFLPLWY